MSFLVWLLLGGLAGYGGWLAWEYQRAPEDPGFATGLDVRFPSDVPDWVLRELDAIEGLPEVAA